MPCETACHQESETSAARHHGGSRRVPRCPRRWRGALSAPPVVDRYYDPQTGQFLSVDPKVQDTQDPYLYATDDPVQWTDPTGLSANPAECGNPSQIFYNQCMVAVRAAEQKGHSSICSAFSHLGHWPRKNIKSAPTTIGRNLGNLAQIAAAGGCVFTGLVWCAAFVVAGIAAELSVQAISGRLTLTSGGETVLLGLADIGGAEIGEELQTIDDTADFSIFKKQWQNIDKAVGKAVKSLIATPDVIVGVSDWRR